jgi:hypothetical protein
MIRDRFAIGITGLTAGGLTTLAALANLEATPRNIDIVALWLAGVLQLALLLIWIFVPRMPRWIVAFWGLILIATGIGVIITAPVPEGASTTPWALLGLFVVGVVTIIVSAVHSPRSSAPLG